MAKKIERVNVKPIVFKDGKKVDLSVMTDQWINEDVIREELKYIAKITEGLVTGTMSNDNEYVIFKNKIVEDLIADHIISIKKKLCDASRDASKIYDYAEMVQNQITKKMQEETQKINSRIEVNGETRCKPLEVEGMNGVGSHSSSSFWDQVFDNWNKNKIQKEEANKKSDKNNKETNIEGHGIRQKPLTPKPEIMHSSIQKVVKKVVKKKATNKKENKK